MHTVKSLQLPDECLAASTEILGIVEVGEYLGDGMFVCYNTKQVMFDLHYYELHPVNLHTEHYVVSSMRGENAEWLLPPDKQVEALDLAESLAGVGVTAENVLEWTDKEIAIVKKFLSPVINR